ncbi:MAG: malonyl-CoA synthase [Alphaproteobacteria bacterium]|nr:malonyl-CoA synthase [Alphaproteobacteria bacterium]
MNLLYDALFAPHAGNTDAFLITPDGGAVRYCDFVARAARLAHVLVDQGATPGDRIVVQVEKSVEALALYAASLQAGAVFLPLNTAYTTAEVTYFLQDSGARLLVCDETAAQHLRPVAEAQGAGVLTLDADGSGSLTEAADKPSKFDTVPRGANDLAGLLYTSGTTGRSKGAMLSHDNLLSNARTLVEAWRFEKEDVLLHALPIFHAHGLFVAMNVALLAGLTVRFFPKFDLDQVIEALPHATAMMGVPTFHTRLLSDPRLTRDLVKRMRVFISGSAPLLADTHAAFETRTGHRILERYGMTETTMITSNPYDGPRKPGKVGPPLDRVEIVVTDPETGAILPPGAVGMLEVRGPNVFQGYWNMPKKTEAAIRPTGFFITGDLGRVDADGYVEIVGRQKDLIITGGYNVYPVEVEAGLNQLEGVVESAVFGVPDADFGEAVAAAIVLEPGCAPDQAALETGVAESLARFKQPRSYIFLDALPRNAMGKVQKAMLREIYG